MFKSGRTISFGWALLLVSIIYAVGIIGFLLPEWNAIIKAATPLNILFCTIILGLFHRHFSRDFILWVLMVAFGGWLIEVAGVATGVLFGEYLYGDNLGPKVFGVPIMMAINWLMLTYMAADISSRLKQGIWLKSAVGASLMVAYDFLLEPIAIHFNMWIWAQTEIPLQNYLAWYVFGFLFQILFHRFIKHSQNQMVIPVLLSQIAFFIVVHLTK
ncbi:MAG: carotenoid biosynthesis protein [Bacteroidetes bacterium]|nr:carotenoid biosynthesis protein [Bacteroidota bacterium]